VPSLDQNRQGRCRPADLVEDGWRDWARFSDHITPLVEGWWIIAVPQPRSRTFIPGLIGMTSTRDSVSQSAFGPI